MSSAICSGDPEKLRTLGQERANLQEVVEAGGQLRKALRDLDEAREVLQGGDPDLKELAQLEAAMNERGYLEGRELATDFRHPDTNKPYNPDFAAMARSAGITGVSVDRAADLHTAIKEAIAANKPCVIDANIDGDLNPAGSGIWELPGIGRSSPGIGKQYVPS